MRWSRLVAIVVLAGALVAVLLWPRARGPRPGAQTGGAPRPALSPAARPADGRAPVSFAWLGQPGVAGRRIAGRVLHAGRAVANATVRLTTDELHVGEWPIAQVETDDVGRFDLGVRPASQYRVVAQADGLVAAGARVDLRASDPRPAPDALAIELGDCNLVVRGTVRDAAGGVIVGARVRAGAHAIDFGIAQSDGQGRYRLCVPSGAFHVEAAADGYGAVVRHARGVRTDVRLDLELAPELAIAGRVVDGDGAPVAGATVLAATDGHDPGAVVDTAADGQFRLAGLGPGQYLVIARSDDRAAESAVKLDGGAAPVELLMKLEARAPLRGRVVVGGLPAAGAKVVVASVDGPWKLGSAVAQADGRFSIAALPRGPARLSVEGHKLVSPDATVDLAVALDVDLVLVCERQASVSGRVVRGGRPIAHAEVGLFQQAARPHRVNAEADGAFKIEGVAAGRYDIYAESIAEGAMMARRPLEVGARDVDGLVLDLGLAASIAGVVVDAEGTPVSGVNVLFVHEDDSGYDVTADDGTFRVTALAGGGDYAAQVSTSAERSSLYLPPPGQALPVVHVRDGTSQVTGVRIVIARGRLTISGRVVRDGEPVAGVDVLALSMRGSARAHSGPDGAFVLDELVAGRYELLALRRDGGHASRRGLVVEAGAKDVRLELPSTGSIEGTLRGFRDAPDVRAAGEAELGSQNGEVTGTTFSIAGLPVGAYLVTAVGPDGASGSAKVVVEADRVARASIEAGPTGRVVGLVSDWRTGAPIPGAACFWRTRSAASSRPVQTDGAGAFAFGAPTGRVDIHCHGVAAPSALVRPVAAEVAPDATASVAVELIVGRRGGTVSPPGVFLEGAAPSPLRVGRVVGSAAASGIRTGDVVLQVDGRSVAGLGPEALSFLISDHDASSPARIIVDRNGAELSFDVAPEPPY